MRHALVAEVQPDWSGGRGRWLRRVADWPSRRSRWSARADGYGRHAPVAIPKSTSAGPELERVIDLRRVHTHRTLAHCDRQVFPSRVLVCTINSPMEKAGHRL